MRGDRQEEVSLQQLFGLGPGTGEWFIKSFMWNFPKVSITVAQRAANNFGKKQKPQKLHQIF